ncbi:peptidoglycan/xylan/chitin deacetylase (PgdA/CDA1 family) [Microbacterium trichothecenolyticum]|uniref:polysaccharide deacetylase family protein n=1 Tax=Microbacterium trichothecenolyticum TaxID=69370 RepID=UPI0028602605|nr:polysaccharide deacetylase family protein [Microbacterium trichothecenolyticum]MDR7185836.1 peptidoglycan/xylan/chitin deacetylase (PgdA/CDA1 family) [Microbacterium trichothecenolyticum]
MLLAAAVAGVSALAACAPERMAVIARRTPSVRPQPTTAPAAHPTPTPTATPTPTPTPTPAPDRVAIAARYAGAVPTQWGTDVSGVRATLVQPTSPSGAPRAALTFDACGGGGGGAFDTELIAGLRSRQAKATLFLNSRWIDANPQLAAELAADPLFVLGNHGTAHVPLSVSGRAAYGSPGTASSQAAVDEVWGNHERLTALTGAAPRFFRAGTAHYDEIAAQIVRDLGETPIGFTVNGDGGATFSSASVRHEFGRLEAGGIVLAHMNHPEGGTCPGALDAVDDLRARGFDLVHVDG